MASIGQLPLPPLEEHPAHSKKRAREETGDLHLPLHATRVAQKSSFMNPVAPLPNQAAFDIPAPSPIQYPSPASSVPSPFPLPVSSEELGRLPVYLRTNTNGLGPSAGTSIGLSNDPFLVPYEPSQSPGEVLPFGGSYIPTTLGMDSGTLLNTNNEDFLSLNNGALGAEPLPQYSATSNAESPDLLEVWSALPSQTGFKCVVSFFLPFIPR